MQPPEKRKSIRRTVTYPAFLDLGDGAPARECTLCDVSQEGAQLAVAAPNSLPNEFILALSSDGAARRRCRVMWRTDARVGVEFLKDFRKSPPAPMPIRHPSFATPAAVPQDGEASAETLAAAVDVDKLAPR
jgi:hypothetical protein